MNPGTHILDEIGHAWQIEMPLGTPGGQGTAYLVRLVAQTTVKGVAKLFHSRAASHEQRLRYLLDEKVGDRSPGLAAPISAISKHHGLGYIAPLAPGEPLVQAMIDRPRNTAELLQIAIELTHKIAALNQGGLGHGDLHPDNIYLDNANNVTLIDVDNFFTTNPAVPPPPAYGHRNYVAPELRSSMLDNKPAAPDFGSDNFALAVLLHRILYLQHPAGHLDGDAARFHDAMTCGRWPARSHPPHPSADAVPFDAYGKSIEHFFEPGFSIQAGNRPTALEWRDLLLKAVSDHRFVIHDCGEAVLVDSLPGRCAFCRQKVDVKRFLLHLHCGNEQIRLAEGEHVIGRQTFHSSSPSVSGRHLIIRFEAAGRLRIKAVGRNPTRIERPDNNAWEKLGNDYWVELGGPAIQLRLADLNIRLTVQHAP